MPQTSPDISYHTNYQLIFDNALQSYKDKTGEDLPSTPLFHTLETYRSSEDVIATLRQEVPAFDKSWRRNDGLTRWLDPTVRVVNAFSATIGSAVALSYPPGGVIFTGIGILLSAADAVSASRGVLLDLFERIENAFRRLDIYLGVPPTAGVTYAVVNVMEKVLEALAIVTREFKQSRIKTFGKKLVKSTTIDDALQKLKTATEEEARTVGAVTLKAVHGVGDSVQGIHDAMRDLKEIKQGVEDRVKGIGGMAVIGVENTGRQMARDTHTIHAESLKTTNEANNEIEYVGNISQSRMRDALEGASHSAGNADSLHEPIKGTVARGIEDIGTAKISQSISRKLGDESLMQPRQEAADWLSPPDPSVNYYTARDTHHKGTTTWFIESNTFRDWKESGSLLWIHGKPGSGKSVLTSAIIQDIGSISNNGSTHMAYFFFDFKDTRKQDPRAFLSSILVQLSNQSVSLGNILLEFYSAHQLEHGSQQPGDRGLMQCLEKMFEVPKEEPIYIIVDGVDECPDTSGLQSLRENVLELIRKLVGFHLSNLRLCVTSRPEIDIRNVLEPLTSPTNRISLHDQDGQKKDIADYIRSVVYSDRKMMRWRDEDKMLVIKTLSERADGMFRWVSCQIEAMRHCLSPSVRRVLQELPESLDETYERILSEIPKANQVHAHRLLQCLTVANRPLLVEELAEILAVEFDPAEGMARLNEDLRWEDQEQAVLSACSSLIAVADLPDSRVVQFSHFSVKEFLTSDRLAESMVNSSCYHHISLEPAHIVMAQACIAVLLRLEFPINKDKIQKFPLADYAATHFAYHAEFGSVVSRISDGIDHLLDEDKPHYAAWMSHISSSWWAEKNSGRSRASPLYHIAELGFYGLVQHLLLKRPQDMVVMGGVLGTPVHAVLHRRHLKVFELFVSYGVDLDIRDFDGQTPLHLAATNALVECARMIIGQKVDINARDNNGWTPLHQIIDIYPLEKKLEIMRLLLEHGADVGARDNDLVTPLHLSAENGQLVAAQLLLQRGASIQAQSNKSWTPLHFASFHGYSDIVQLFIDHGAELEAQNNEHNTPLHLAALQGKVSVVQALLENRTNIHARGSDSGTPLHHASWAGHPDVIQLLLEHGADLGAQDAGKNTPLHVAIIMGKLKAVQALLKNHANVHARGSDSGTPLHHASFFGHPDIIQLLMEHGADLGAQDAGKNTPLHVAIITGKLKAVQALLEHHANVHARGSDSGTPLHHASFFGHPDIIQLLLEHGADLEAQDACKNTPLHVAANKGNVTAVQALLKHHANVHARGSDSKTPLHHASFFGDPDLILLLLKCRADVNAQDDERETSLHLAVKNGKLEAVRLLLEYGASVHSKNKKRQTPLQVASSRGSREIMDLLHEHMQRE